ncbi:glycosyltransferase family 4 protein [Sphingomonas sp.]|uniref:glycosyltransferase family 4 protein n=1 Tax=Sphingomonas sp. TaxID=28214 RepID=UPI002DD634B3|nr:glycosyltransferase family 4 protein [Sphingomonas sp.]
MTVGTILFVAPQARFFLSHRVRIALAAQEAGWRAVVACPESDDAEAFTRLGLAHAALPVARSGLNPLRDLATIARLRQIIRSYRPDVAHLITAKSALWGGLACRLSGTPSVTAITGLGYVFTEDSHRNRLLRRILLTAYRVLLNHRRNHFVFQNPNDRAIFATAGVLDHAASTMLPGAGVDLFAITAKPAPPEPPVVVLPARMLKMKGVEDFHAAALILRDEGIDVTMRLVGDPDPSNPTSMNRHVLEDWAARGEVEWLGHRLDIDRVLADCHIVALPSRGGEGLPKTLIDAAAAGRPAVATAIPGCTEAIVAGTTGLLCRSRDPVDLAAKLRVLIADRKLRETMGAAARRHAEDVFDIQRVISAHLDIYGALAKGDARALERNVT